MVLWKQSFSY